MRVGSENASAEEAEDQVAEAGQVERREREAQHEHAGDVAQPHRVAGRRRNTCTGAGRRNTGTLMIVGRITFTNGWRAMTG